MSRRGLRLKGGHQFSSCSGAEIGEQSSRYSEFKGSAILSNRLPYFDFQGMFEGDVDLGGNNPTTEGTESKNITDLFTEL